MRAAGLLPLALLSALANLPAPIPAPPPALLRGPVTDTAGALTRGEESAASRALADLAPRGIRLRALFVPTTGDESVESYADSVARRNRLRDDALLVVAVHDRRYALWVGRELRDEVTDAEVEQVLTDRTAPLVRDGRFAAAVVATGERVADATRGDLPARGGLPLLLLLAALTALAGGLYHPRG